MEQLAQFFNNLTQEQQIKFLENFTLTQQYHMKNYFGAYKLMTDTQFYKEVKNAIAETVYENYRR